VLEPEVLDTSHAKWNQFRKDAKSLVPAELSLKERNETYSRLYREFKDMEIPIDEFLDKYRNPAATDSIPKKKKKLQIFEQEKENLPQNSRKQEKKVKSELTRDKVALLFTENLLLKQELSLKEEEERRERERQRKDNQKSLLKEYQKLLASLN